MFKKLVEQPLLLLLYPLLSIYCFMCVIYPLFIKKGSLFYINNNNNNNRFMCTYDKLNLICN